MTNTTPCTCRHFIHDHKDYEGKCLVLGCICAFYLSAPEATGGKHE